MRLSRTAKVCYKFKQIENFKSVRLPLRVCLCMCACVCVRLFICLSTAGCCLTLTVPHFEATPNWFGICPWLIQAINAPVSLPTLSHTLTHTHTDAETFTRTVCLLFQWEIAGHFITKRVIGSNLFAPSKLGWRRERKKPFCALASTWARDECVIWLIHVHIVRNLPYQLDCTVNIKIDKIMSTDLYSKHFNVVITARLYFNNCHSTSLPLLSLFLSPFIPLHLFSPP